MRCLVVALALCLVSSSGLAQNPPPSSAPLTYAGALQRALVANPTLLAARLRRSVALASRDVAAERLNPEFRAEFARETPKEAYTLAVPWELGGKRAARIAVGDAAIVTADAELTAIAAQVQADVRSAYLDRFVAESRQTLLVEMQTLSQRARDAAQARVDAGDSPRLELLEAELALADARNQAAAATGAVRAARTVLNGLLGFPLDAPTPIDLTLEADVGAAVDVAVARARQSHAELAVLDRRIEEQRARVALAQAMRRPDITPEGTLTHRAEPEFSFGWRAALAVTLPVFTSHTAAVAMERATLTQLTAEREAEVARISAEVTGAVALAEAQREQYIRYRDQILPQATEVERLAEDAYRLGQTNIAAYLQSLQSTRDVRLRALQSNVDFQRALAELERAIGAPPAMPLAPTTGVTPP